MSPVPLRVYCAKTFTYGLQPVDVFFVVFILSFRVNRLQVKVSLLRNEYIYYLTNRYSTKNEAPRLRVSGFYLFRIQFITK
jgi:hypothetical protein